ncbi:cytochrome P450 71A3-like isoform X2 [Quercus lobata]|uniref:cytochrome P450 71A3-like isoform X2 n=1 Tax=Quercus lobata TaxID=97700 RepID=UPI001247E9A3|nr:cytochrome P450 71A3-like isoform X2 [Quercus lobata]
MSQFLQFLVTNVTSFLLQPSVLTILAFIFILLFKWYSILPNGNTKKNSPPSPPKLPIIGNLHQLGLQPHRSLQTLAQRHGPLMLLHFGSVPVLVVSSADAAQEIMKTRDLNFADRPKSGISEKLLYNYKDVASAPYGEYWRQMKSILVLHLLSNKRVQSFCSVRKEETFLMIDKIKESCSSSSVNLSEIFAKLTNDVVCRVALGKKYGEGEGRKKFKELLGEFAELLGAINVGDYIPSLAWLNRANGFDAKAEKVAKQLDDFLEGVIEEHINCQKKGDHDRGFTFSQENEDQKDFVDILLWIQEENVIGFPVDRDSIKALILDAFAAGTDTTYTVLEWTMTELIRHPEMMKKVQNEVREIAGNKKDITEDDLDKMHYLKAIIKETLRLHPPIPLLVPRKSIQDAKIHGYDIAAGTQVIINVWTIGKDPTLWDEPEEFQPESFLTSSTTIELVMANLVRNFEWTLPDGAIGKDLDMTESTGLTIHRKFPLMAIATPYFG